MQTHMEKLGYYKRETNGSGVGMEAISEQTNQPTAPWTGCFRSYAATRCVQHDPLGLTCLKSSGENRTPGVLPEIAEDDEQSAT